MIAFIRGSMYRLGFLFLLATSALFADTQGTPRTYVGVAACVKCHDAGVWAQSRHSKMVQPIDTAEIKGDFARPSVILRGKRYGLEHKGKEYFITETYLSSKPQRHRVDYTLGSRRIQHYLSTLPDGKIIVLPPTWDVVRKQWFHNLDIGDPEEDPGAQVQIWNKHCYGCHVSKEDKHYDQEKLRYDTSWLDFGVNCERCHGPGSEHVAKYEKGATGTKDSAIVVQTRLDPARNTMVCGQCHSFRDIFVDGFTAGSNYYDHFRPVLEYALPAKEEPAYYVDGRTRRFSNDAFGLWQSECYLKGGLTCVQCHATPHNTNIDKNPQLQATNNALCIRCHEAIGKDVAAHTHHDLSSTGSSCVECHMPREVFSIKAQIRDHTMSVPVPENTVKYGVPNACNICHTSKTQDAAWAVQRVNQWYGAGGRRNKWIRRADAFASARKGDPSAVAKLIAIVSNPGEAPMARANAIGHLGNFNGDARTFPALVSAMIDSDPLVRSTAALTLRPAGAAQRPAAVYALVGLLNDPVTTVRMGAAVSLMSMGVTRLQGKDGERLEQSKMLLRARAELGSDDAEQQTALGRFFMLDGNPMAAIAAFKASLRLDPTSPVKSLLANAYMQAGQQEEARKLLQTVSPRAGAAPKAH